MQPWKLKQSQIDEFHERGFIVIRGLLFADEVAEMNIGYSRAINGEVDNPNWQKRIARGSILQLGNPSALLEWRGFPYFERLRSISKQLAGDDIEFAYDQLIYKPPHNPIELLWHQDAGYNWQGEKSERGLTSWLALVDVIPPQGSMQFIPHSHKHGIFEHHDATDRNPVNGALEVKVDKRKAVAVTYQAGDCSFHHGRMLHYTGPNTTDQPRRSLSTHFWPKV